MGTDTWTELAHQPLDANVTSNNQDSMCAYDKNSGLVVTAGGYRFYNGEFDPRRTDQVLLYNPSLDTWIEGPKLPFILESGIMVEVNGKLHIFGGVTGKKMSDKIC